MSILDRFLGALAPGVALRRTRARLALTAARGVLANYDAATVGRRGKSWKVSSADADGAARRRGRLAHITRDMIRNTPFAARGQMVIANNVVGGGILPKMTVVPDAVQAEGRDLIKRHYESRSIDADGQSTLYGLQRLAMFAVIDAGEVLIRRRRRRLSDGLALPFQIQVIEADFLDTAKEGQTGNGGVILEGIEFDRLGRRVAYWLFDEHPGASSAALRRGFKSRRVPASEIAHIYRADRPGQRRGVSWFAPVALSLQDFADNQDAKLMQQKIAACFAAFRVDLDGDTSSGVVEGADDDGKDIATIQPGAVYDLRPGEDIRFAAPPKVEGFDEFARVVLRSAAMGLGITYEALVGDLGSVNFSSARMGRIEMNRNVEAWQWHMMVPQFLEPLARWTLEAWALQAGQPEALDARIEWAPPPLTMADPRLEAAAAKARREIGLTSLQWEQRSWGLDPEDVHREQLEDLRRERELLAADPSTENETDGAAGAD